MLSAELADANLIAYKLPPIFHDPGFVVQHSLAEIERANITIDGAPSYSGERMLVMKLQQYGARPRTITTTITTTLTTTEIQKLDVTDLTIAVGASVIVGMAAGFGLALTRRSRKSNPTDKKITKRERPVV
jgi:hypothetical protein